VFNEVQSWYLRKRADKDEGFSHERFFSEDKGKFLLIPGHKTQGGIEGYSFFNLGTR
jgi:hypothetical protein